jgi:type II secretory pathway component GspD/PulD (secretin)
MADKTEQILVHLEYLRAGQDETNAHLKELNGRVSRVEIRAAVLEAKSDDAKASGAKWGAGVGAAIAAIIAGLSQLFGK